jgi:hypothetical protein
MNSTVVPEGDGCRALIPIFLPFGDTPPKGIDNRTTKTFNLPISLRVVGNRKDFVNSELSANGQEEFRSELPTIVRKDIAWVLRCAGHENDWMRGPVDAQ